MATNIIAQKVFPPQPQGLIKKKQRDTKRAQTLEAARKTRRQANVLKRAEILKRSQQHHQNYVNSKKSQVQLRRKAKLSGSIYVPAEARVVLVVRIRGIIKLNPKVVRILRLLRLRQLHNAVFIRVNKATINMLRRVEPYIAYGYPTRETIRRLIYKRGYGKINGQRIPLTNNQLIENSLGKKNIICIEDLINQIASVGANFKQANNFIWPFKLRPPRGGFSAKRHPFQRGGDWGNREDLINDLANRML